MSGFVNSLVGGAKWALNRVNPYGSPWTYYYLTPQSSAQEVKEALLDAMRSKRPDLVISFIKKSLDLPLRDWDNLHNYVHIKEEDIDSGFITKLFLEAMEIGDLTVPEYLHESYELSTRIKWEYKDDEGRTFLHYAARIKNEGIFNFFLKQVSSNIPDKNGMLAVHEASLNGFTAAVITLCSKDVEYLNAKGNWNRTPLHFAVMGESIETVEALTSLGASLSSRDNDGNMPHHLAAARGHKASLLYLVGMKPMLLEAQGEDGATALLIAAGEGQLGIVKELVEGDKRFRADCQVKDEQGKGFLVYASTKSISVYSFVLERYKRLHLSINERDDTGRTLLHEVAQKKDATFLERTLKEFPDVNAVTWSQNITVLQSALRFDARSPRIVPMLLQSGAHIIWGDNELNATCRDSKGRTTVHYAVKYGTPEELKLVLEAGVREKLKAQGIKESDPLYGLKKIEAHRELTTETDLQGRSPIDEAATIIRSKGGYQDSHSQSLLRVLLGDLEGGGQDPSSFSVIKAMQLQSVEMFDTLYDQLVGVCGEEQALVRLNIERDSFGYNILHWACIEGNEGLLESLILKGVDLTEKDNDGNNVLHLASKFKNRGCLSRLFQELERRGQLELRDKVNSIGYTPIMVSVLALAHECVVECISNGASLSVQSLEGDTVLHLACRLEDVAIVKSLISGGAPLGRKNLKGYTELHVAAEAGAVVIVQELFKSYGLDTRGVLTFCEIRNKYGLTALHLSARRGNIAVFKEFEALGVKIIPEREVFKENREGDANDIAIDQNGWNVLHHAVYGPRRHEHTNPKDHEDFIRYLVTQYPALMGCRARYGKLPIHIAAEYKLNGALRLLANMDSQQLREVNDEGSSALLAASKEANSDAIEFILRTDTSLVNAQDFQGWSALHLAASAGSLRSCIMLSKYGADIHQVDGMGRIALHAAVNKVCVEESKESVQIVDWLVAKGSLVNCMDKLCRTPLHDAAKNGLVTIGSYLISKGAYIDARAYRYQVSEEERAVREGRKVGTTPYHDAASNDHLPFLKMLFSQQKEPLKTLPKDEDGRTPIHVAASRGLSEPIIFFHSQGFSLKERDDNGASALDLAIAGRFHALVKELLVRGIDPNDKGEGKRPPIVDAAGRGDLEMVILLHSKGAKCDSRSLDGLCLMHFAVLSGKKELIEWVYGILGNEGLFETNEMGYNAFHKAAQKGDAESFFILVDLAISKQGLKQEFRGFVSGNHQEVSCEPKSFRTILRIGDAITEDGYNYLQLATMSGSLQLVKFFKWIKVDLVATSPFEIPPPTPNTASSFPEIVLGEDFSPEAGSLEEVKSIKTESSEDIEEIPLMRSLAAILYAIKAGHIEIVKELYDPKTFLSLKDSFHHNGLMLAATCGQLEVLKCLIEEKGIVPNLEALFKCAMYAEKRNVVFYLIDLHLTRFKEFRPLFNAHRVLNRKDTANGDSLLNWAIELGDVRYFNWCMDRVEILGVNARRENSLHVACRHGFQHAIFRISQTKELLVGRDQEGNWPIHQALAAGIEANVLALLRAYNEQGYSCAEVLVKENQRGLTPIQCALEKGHIELVKTIRILVGADEKIEESSPNEKTLEAVELNEESLAHLSLDNPSTSEDLDTKVVKWMQYVSEMKMIKGSQEKGGVKLEKL